MYVTLKGQMGSSPEVQLSNGASGGNFERSHVDTFTINTKDLGELKTLQIRLVGPKMLVWLASHLHFTHVILPGSHWPSNTF